MFVAGSTRPSPCPSAAVCTRWASARTAPSPTRGSGTGRPSATCRSTSSVEVTGAPSIDHARLGQDGQELRSAGQRLLLRSRATSGDQVSPGSAATPAASADSHDREDRPLDRAHDRLVHGVGGGPQGLRHPRPPSPGSRPRPRSPAAPGTGSTPELPRAPGRAVADRVAHRRQVVVDALQFLEDRAQREGHVRAGVAVGNRVDVEPVDGLPMGRQGVVVMPSPPLATPAARVIRRGHEAAS